MDLQELRMAYDNAVKQIEVLDMCLSELAQRQEQAVLNNTYPDFDYIDFKLETMQGVKNMYEEYRDKKWTQLQLESTKALHEVLNRHDNHHQATPLTPPLSPSDQVYNMSPPTTSDRYRIEDVHIHMIPAPLTPIHNIDDLMLTPPGSPRAGEPDRFYYSRNLTIPMYGELSRDY